MRAGKFLAASPLGHLVPPDLTSLTHVGLDARALLGAGAFSALPRQRRATIDPLPLHRAKKAAHPFGGRFIVGHCQPILP